MSEFTVGQLVRINRDTAPYGGRLGEVVLVARCMKYGIGVHPLFERNVQDLAYSSDEISHVTVDNVPLRAGQVWL